MLSKQLDIWIWNHRTDLSWRYKVDTHRQIDGVQSCEFRRDSDRSECKGIGWSPGILPPLLVKTMRKNPAGWLGAAIERRKALWDVQEAKRRNIFQEEAHQLYFMLLIDLSRPRSVAILMGSVWVGPKWIRMDLGLRSRRETWENVYRLSLLRSFAVKGSQEER